MTVRLQPIIDPTLSLLPYQDITRELCRPSGVRFGNARLGLARPLNDSLYTNIGLALNRLLPCSLETSFKP